MHKVALMHISDCSDDIIEYFLGYGLGKIFVFDDYIKKLFAWAHLCEYVDVVVVFEVLIHLHDVGVVLNVPLRTRDRSMLNSLMIIFSSLMFFRRSIFFIARILSKLLRAVLVSRLRTLKTSEKDPFPILSKN